MEDKSNNLYFIRQKHALEYKKREALRNNEHLAAEILKILPKIDEFYGVTIACFKTKSLFYNEVYNSKDRDYVAKIEDVINQFEALKKALMPFIEKISFLTSCAKLLEQCYSLLEKLLSELSHGSDYCYDHFASKFVYYFWNIKYRFWYASEMLNARFPNIHIKEMVEKVKEDYNEKINKYLYERIIEFIDEFGCLCIENLMPIFGDISGDQDIEKFKIVYERDDFFGRVDYAVETTGQVFLKAKLLSNDSNENFADGVNVIVKTLAAMSRSRGMAYDIFYFQYIKPLVDQVHSFLWSLAIYEDKLKKKPVGLVPCEVEQKEDWFHQKPSYRRLLHEGALRSVIYQYQRNRSLWSIIFGQEFEYIDMLLSFLNIDAHKLPQVFAEKKHLDYVDLDEFLENKGRAYVPFLKECFKAVADGKGCADIFKKWALHPKLLEHKSLLSLLPDDIKGEIFSYLSVKDVNKVSRLSFFYHQQTYSFTYWKEKFIEKGCNKDALLEAVGCNVIRNYKNLFAAYVNATRNGNIIDKAWHFLFLSGEPNAIKFAIEKYDVKPSMRVKQVFGENSSYNLTANSQYSSNYGRLFLNYKSFYNSFYKPSTISHQTFSNHWNGFT